MKKLLSIITITTLTSSIPAPLLANTLQPRVKRDVGVSNSNNDYLPIKEFKNIHGDIYRMTIDSNDNIYFSVFDNGEFVLKHGETTANRIDDINNVVNSLAVDSKDNVYFATNSGAFVLKHGADTLTKINGINSKILFVTADSNDNIYFGVYQNGVFVLKQGATTPTKIDGINDIVNAIAVDKNNNIYYVTKDGAFVLKQGSETPTKINDIIGYVYSLAIDSKNNVYIGTSMFAFVLKQGATTPTKIDGINDIVNYLAVDSKDNVYFATNSGAFVLKHGKTTAKKIYGIGYLIYRIIIDSYNNIYYVTKDGTFVLRYGESTPTKIDGISNNIQSITIDSKDNIYFGTNNGAYKFQTSLMWAKQQSNFVLVDSTKTKNWTRPDFLAVDGEVNIDIANPNIDKVVFDNVQQPQTSKHWTINVKPETALRYHNLQVMFTLGGKQYTSEITVYMQAKIAPPATPVQQNLSDLIITTDLGSIINNNDDTIFTAVNQKNGNVIDDFSQIKMTKKDNHLATLTAKKDSKSYTGSVNVTYNIVPATVVDLEIDVTPTSSTATVVKDYVGQIDTSNLTNPVNTFYWANSESTITMVKLTLISVIIGVVYGCDEQWNKTTQSSPIDPTSGIKLDGSQLATTNGKYVVELSDNLGHTNNVYLQIAKDKKIANYFDTDNGKYFEIWAKANGHENIRGYGASQLNKLFTESKNWQQIANESQFASAVADLFKTNGKLVSKSPLFTHT